MKQEHLVLERSARLNLDPQDLKKKCFQGEDDVCWRKIRNLLKSTKINRKESGYSI